MQATSLLSGVHMALNPGLPTSRESRDLLGIQLAASLIFISFGVKAASRSQDGGRSVAAREIAD
jgi:hypothetical protein